MKKVIVAFNPEAPAEFRWTVMPYEYNGPPEHVARGPTRNEAIADFVWYHSTNDDDERELLANLVIIEGDTPCTQ